MTTGPADLHSLLPPLDSAQSSRHLAVIGCMLSLRPWYCWQARRNDTGQALIGAVKQKPQLNVGALWHTTQHLGTESG